MLLHSGGRPLLRPKAALARTRIQKLFGDLDEDGWRNAWVNERRGYHGRWVDSGFFVREGDSVIHRDSGSQGVVEGAFEGREGGNQLRVRSPRGIQHTFDPREVRLTSGHPMAGIGLGLRHRLPQHTNDEAEHALTWYPSATTFGGAVPEVSRRYAPAGHGHHLVEGQSGRRYIVRRAPGNAGWQLVSKGAPKKIGQVDQTGLSWENVTNAAGIPEPSVRMAKVGEVSRAGVFLVEGQSGAKYLTSPTMDSSGLQHWHVIDRQAAPQPEPHHNSAGQPVQEGQLVSTPGGTTAEVHSLRHVGTASRATLMVQGSGTEVHNTSTLLPHTGVTHDSAGSVLRVGDSVSFGGIDRHPMRIIRIGVGGARNQTLLMLSGGTMAYADQVTAAHRPTETRAAPAPAPATGDRSRWGQRLRPGDPLPAWNLNHGDRVVHTATGAAGTAVGHRVNNRGEHRIRVRLDDGRVAQYPPHRLRFADAHHGRAGFNGRIQERESAPAEPASAPTPPRETTPAPPAEPAPVATPDAHGHITELPPRALPGNQDYGFELEWNHPDSSTGSIHDISAHAVGQALAQEHGEGSTSHRHGGLGFIGGYHQGGRIPHFKVERDSTVSGGEVVSPILGGDHPFTYGDTANPEMPWAQANRDPEATRTAVHGYSQTHHVKRHIDGATGMRMLGTVMRAIKAAGGRPGLGTNNSTSLHVTLGLKDLHRQGGDAAVESAVRNIVRGYKANEDNISQTFPRGRENSSWNGNNRVGPALLRSVSAAVIDGRGSTDRLRSISSLAGNDHMSPINLGNLYGSGKTLEFRGPGGTLDPSHGQAMIEMMAALTQAAKAGHEMPAQSSPAAMLSWLHDNGGLPTDTVQYLSQKAASRNVASRASGGPSAVSLGEFNANARRVPAESMAVGDRVRIGGYIRTVTGVEILGPGYYPGRGGRLTYISRPVRVSYRIANGATRTSMFGRYRGVVVQRQQL